MKFWFKQDRWYKRAWLPMSGFVVWFAAAQLFPFNVAFPIMVVAMAGMVGGGLVYMVLGSPYDDLEINDTSKETNTK